MRHTGASLFVGREPELAAIEACVDDAAGGRAWVVWIEGEAGSGKTALVDRVVETLPSAFAVLRADADELAIDVPFGVVAELGGITAESGFAAGLQLLGRWAEVQDARPVAVVVEDLHWADARSREALLTAGRRLGRDRVVLIVTSRPGGGSGDSWDRLRLDSRRCRQVEVRALTVDEVAALAAASGVVLSERAAERLHRHTAGHALHVRALLAELDPARLADVEGGLPAPRSLASTTVARLARLPGDTRHLALALAVVGRPVALPLAGRIAGVARPTEALERLLDSGLVTWAARGGETVIGFAHPLYRVALYEDMSPTRRQALHRAAAAALGPGEALDHRLAATDGADLGLANDLAAAAVREAERGACTLAARHLLGAASVDPERERAEPRLLQAVRLLLGDGRVQRAVELRERVEACAESRLRDLVLGSLDAAVGRGAIAEAVLRRAAAATERDVATAALVELGMLHTAQGRGREAVEIGQRLLATPDLRPAEERNAWIIAVLGELFTRGAPAALDRLAPRLPQPAEDVPRVDADLLVTRGTLGFYAGRATAAIADLRVAVRLARETDVAQALPRAHLQLAQLLAGTGCWDEASRHARTALALVAEEQRVWMQAQAHSAMGRMQACRGDWVQAEEQIAAAGAAATAVGTAEAMFTFCIARATLARARGDPAQVVAAFAPVLADARPLPMATSLGWWPMIISATIDRGDLGAARDQLDRLRAAADERGLGMQALIVGLAGRLALASGDADSAIDGLRRATMLAGPDVQVLDRAELHHRLGQLLVARGRRRDGLAQLHRARELLDGAEPFLRRVDADLASAGLRSSRAPRGASRRSPLALTERERDVVALVAQGLTNREAAAELYISDKAVEYHLGNVYGKLGIRSRRELRARVGAGL